MAPTGTNPPPIVTYGVVICKSSWVLQKTGVLEDRVHIFFFSPREQDFIDFYRVNVATLKCQLNIRIKNFDFLTLGLKVDAGGWGDGSA